MVNPERHKDARPEDLAKASLVTVTNNIGAIARMCASISVRCMCERERTLHVSLAYAFSLQLLTLRLSSLPPYMRGWEEGKQWSGTCMIFDVQGFIGLLNIYNLMYSSSSLSSQYNTCTLTTLGCGAGHIRWQLPVWQRDVCADVGLCHGVLVTGNHSCPLPRARGLLWCTG